MSPVPIGVLAIETTPDAPAARSHWATASATEQNLSGLFVEGQAVEGSPSRIGWRLLINELFVGLDRGGIALRVGANAVVGAERNQRERQQCRFANDRGEIDTFVLDRPCLTLGGVALENLPHVGQDLSDDGFEAAATRTGPLTGQGASRGDTFGDCLDDEVGVKQSVDDGEFAGFEIVELCVDLEVSARSNSASKLECVDEELAGGSEPRTVGH